MRPFEPRRSRRKKRARGRVCGEAAFVLFVVEINSVILLEAAVNLEALGGEDVV